MAAEFDTQSTYRGEGDPPSPQGDDDSSSARGIWGTIALLILCALVVLFVLTQCVATVPNVVGLDRTAAKTTLTRAGLAMGEISEIPDEDEAPGDVCEQIPEAGAVARKGARVDLMVAQGTNLKTVPNVVGHDSASASIIVQQAGFETRNAEEFSDTVPRGAAVSQSPPGGSLAPAGSTVTVFYSIGPQSDVTPTVDHTDTDDGLTEESRDSVGSNSDPLIMSLARAYPGATAWSSGGDIYVQLSPGSGARRVTSTGDWDTDPVIAPSHRYLVFLRASGQGRRSTEVAAVSLTDFSTHTLSTVPVSLRTSANHWYGRPVFAPSENSTTPDTDWIVYAQHFREGPRPGSYRESARLIICKVPIDSKWASWNEKFRPARTLTIMRSGRPGCVRVRQTSGGRVLYDRDFQLSTGLYLR